MYYDHDDLVNYLLQSTAVLDEWRQSASNRERSYVNPLAMASLLRKKDLVNRMLQIRDMNYLDSDGVEFYPLNLACMTDSDDVSYYANCGIHHEDWLLPGTALGPNICIDIEIVTALVKAGADVNSSTENGYSLEHAVRAGDARALQYLLDRGADVFLGSLFASPLLVIAVQCSFLDIVRILLDHEDIEVNAPPLGWNCPAAYATSLPIAQALLDAGADLNVSIEGPFGDMSVLMDVCQRGNDAVVELFLSAGANPHNDDILEYSPRYAAAKADLVNSIRILVQEYKVDINDLSGRYKRAALHAASQANNLAAACLLIELGANINISDFRGRRPIHDAVSPAMIHMLASHGAEIASSSDPLAISGRDDHSRGVSAAQEQR